jgi:glycosyltransferase involved in cell wall biosynthesis
MCGASAERDAKRTDLLDLPQPVGLVAPLPPQVGGVASVAAWLLANQDDLGCEYDAFDLWRPATAQLGGRLQLSAIPRQIRLAVGFARWLRHAPRVIHYCFACSFVSLARDLAFIVMARIAGKTVIAHVHGSEFATHPRARFVHAPAVRLLSRVTAERVALTPWAGIQLARIGVTSKCIVNPLRIRPPDGFVASADNRLRLLFVGTYGKAKGCHDLIDAVAKARAGGIDANLLFVGKEMYKGEEAALRGQAKRCNIEDDVEFAGLKLPDELSSYYASADVICLPSYREVLPMALLEGMSYGLPALASTVGGIPDIVETGCTGVLVRPGAVDELTEGIRFLAGDSDRRRRIGRAARERVLSLADPATIVTQWRELYAGVR